MVHEVQMGTRKRMSFSRINEVLDMPDLIEVQKNSYKRFVEEDLREVLDDISPITDYTEKLVLEFVDYSIDFDHPKYSVEECKERDVNYCAPLKVLVRLINKETGEVKEQPVFMGDFPLMTEQGTFIINGAERVIVSQLVRSPGVYYTRSIDKLGKNLYSAQVIPNRGAWLEYETDFNNVFWVRIDKNRKLPITCLIRALGLKTDREILDTFGDDPRIRVTLEKDTCKTYEEAMLEIYRKLRPGEPPTVDSAETLVHNLFFDPRRYDLSVVGRYKFNKKLTLWARCRGQKLAAQLLALVLAQQLLEDIVAHPLLDAALLQGVEVHIVGHIAHAVGKHPDGVVVVQGDLHLADTHGVQHPALIAGEDMAPAACAAWASCCRTSSASALAAWSG